MLGTNGGGFMNANAAHPFENPTALSNLLQMILMICLGAALTNVFGRMVGNQMQGWALFGAMRFCLLVGVSDALRSRKRGQSKFCRLRRRSNVKRVCNRAAIWKARKFVSALPIRPYSRR